MRACRSDNPKAVEAGLDPVEGVAKAVYGRILFSGKVVEKQWEDKEGYLWRTNTTEGHDRFKNHIFKIFFKNENHVSWLDGEPYVTSPDIIEVVRKDTGEPITNTDIKEGDVVSVIGLSCRKAFETPKGLHVLGPRNFGFDIEHVPIEKVA